MKGERPLTSEGTGKKRVKGLAAVQKPAKRKKKKHAKAAQRVVPEKGPAAAETSPAPSLPAAAAKPAPAWPFQPHPADHCETPQLAYSELAPLLQRLAWNLHGDGSSSGGSPAAAAAAAAKLRIYDPYFCTGRVKEHLAELGFPQVHNVCEDFYQAVDAGQLPEFDVIVTNPPYTACAPARPRPSLFHGTTDHVERLLRFCRDCRKPCALLLPNYVYMKQYFGEATRGLVLAALEPSGRYTYDAPRAAPGDEAFTDANGQTRNKKTKKTAPFMSFWYLLAPGAAPQQRWWAGQGAALPRVHALAALPNHLRDSFDPRRVKPKKTAGPKTSRDGRPLCRQCGQVVGCCKHTRKE